MDEVVFQKATENDLDAILDIYNYYIATTTATFDIGPVSKEELCQRVCLGHDKYGPFLIKYDGEVAGFCFLTQFKKKKAYDRTAEAGLYLKPGYTGQGIGRAATAFLEETARERDIKVLVACISAENSGSVRLLEKMGYEKCAHYKQVGEKFGRLLDVVDYQKVLV